jgi:hypothetical protein
MSVCFAFSTPAKYRLGTINYIAIKDLVKEINIRPRRKYNIVKE